MQVKSGSMDQTLRIAEKHFTSNPFDQVSQRDYLGGYYETLLLYGS